jgi:hypothetical protein
MYNQTRSAFASFSSPTNAKGGSNPTILINH